MEIQLGLLVVLGRTVCGCMKLARDWSWRWSRWKRGFAQDR
jgi:hypothetical protein